MARSWRVPLVLGSALLASAAVLAALPFFHLPPQIAYAAIGPAAAGSINTAMGLHFRTASRGTEIVVLSPEARSLLHALIVRAQVWRGSQKRRGLRIGPNLPAPYCGVTEPPRAALEKLERAAAAHNRIAASLGPTKDERAARILAAADAGMGEALEAAAQAARQGGEERALEQMEATIGQLQELADRVEASAVLPTPESGLRSALASTLDELRSEELARRELETR